MELSVQTINHIFYEVGKVKLFRANSLVLKTHPRSVLSLEGREIYDKEYGN
jgi:hypothetical protein